MGKKKAKKAAARAVFHGGQLKGATLLQRKLEDAPFGSDPDDALLTIRDAMVSAMDSSNPRLGYMDRRQEDFAARLERLERALITQAETIAALGRAVLSDDG